MARGARANRPGMASLARSRGLQHWWRILHSCPPMPFVQFSCATPASPQALPKWNSLSPRSRASWARCD
eukprot:8174867-Lingulodinium_polyedra.AAC.1